LHRLAAVDGDGTYVEAKSKMLWLRPFGVVLSLEPDVLDGAQRRGYSSHVFVRWFLESMMS
jgi:hypothetical protein